MSINNNKINCQSSFSLIEVLIFVTILTLFFVVAASVTTTSLRNMQVNEHKILATRYAEELLEWLRSKKDVNWTSFSSKSDDTGKIYCANGVLDYSNPSNFTQGQPGWTWTAYSTCNSNSTVLYPTNLYKREFTLKNVGNCNGIVCQILVTIEVKWQEVGNSYSVPIKTIFSVWEN